MNSLAVVILNYNGVKLLEKFLPNVVDYSPEAHVVIIDNASTDGSVPWIKMNHPSIQCIALSQNFGYASGYNKGLKEVKAEIYCLLNSDVLVTKNWLPP